VKTASYEKNVLILGGGISGLSAAYYLRLNDVPSTVFDALDKPGGNCRTIQIDEFMFDTGAHRVHDKDNEITEQVKKLLGANLKRINAPSKIFDNGRFLSFPLEFQDVFRRMDKCFTIRAGLDFLKSRSRKGYSDDFESFAVYSYGRSMAERFLLNYSRKLWGIPCNMLSPEVSGERLKSITFITLLKNFISRRYAEFAHYEGEFYYPDRGIGQLSEALAQFIGHENIRLNSRVTGILHDGTRIEGIMIDGHDPIRINQVISTLAISDFITMMRPAPPQEILNIAKSLKFRNIRLAVFLLRGEGINNAATIYFPADKFIFTRGYEPKNRSKSMSPQGMTSFVVEVPCFEHEWEWNADHTDFMKKVREQIIETGLIRDNDIIGCTDERVVNAYPVLEKDYKEKVLSIFEYLSRFQNLEVSGRIGLFKYLWIHNLLREGQDIAGRVIGKMSKSNRRV
jgi:protoporphyrinogen oxidase